MTTLAAVRAHVRHHPWQAWTRHYLRTPKGSLLTILAVLFVVSSSPASARRVLLPLTMSLAVVLCVDLPWLRWRRRRLSRPIRSSAAGFSSRRSALRRRASDC